MTTLPKISEYDTLECPKYWCDRMVKPHSRDKHGIVSYKCKCSHEFKIGIDWDLFE